MSGSLEIQNIEDVALVLVAIGYGIGNSSRTPGITTDCLLDRVSADAHQLVAVGAPHYSAPVVLVPHPHQDVAELDGRSLRPAARFDQCALYRLERKIDVAGIKVGLYAVLPKYPKLPMAGEEGNDNVRAGVGVGKIEQAPGRAIFQRRDIEPLALARRARIGYEITVEISNLVWREPYCILRQGVCRKGKDKALLRPAGDIQLRLVVGHERLAYPERGRQ